MTETQKHSASGRIILVDNNLDIRTMMEMILGDHFQVCTVSSAEAGLDMVEAEGPFDIVMASFTLSGMNGVEFLRRVSEKHPDTVRILLTGGCEGMCNLHQAISKGHISRIVFKPFRINILLDQLKQDMSLKNDSQSIPSVTTPEAL